MKSTMTQLFLLITGIWMGMGCFAPAYGFIGEYNSSTGNDMAGIIMFKSSALDYEDSDDTEFDVERKSLILGVSKAIDSKLKLFGSFNIALDGKIDDVGYDLDHGYSLTGAGSYTFLKQDNYCISGFGQLDFILEEEYQSSNSEITFDGYEMLIGAMGKYNFNPKLSGYAVFELLLLSDVTGDVDHDIYLDDFGWVQQGSYDTERDGGFGLKLGGIYDEPQWFLKGEFAIGMDTGFAFCGGRKF